MNQTLRSGILLFTAALVVFGGIYLLEKHSGWRPLAGPIVSPQIIGSASAMSPIQTDTRPLAEPWEVKRFSGQGLAPKLVAISKPVPRAPSKVSFARAQCNRWQKYIESLDEAALHPSPDFDEDRIERERKKAREMLFGLDCEHA